MSFLRNNWRSAFVLSLAVALLFVPAIAQAATGGGGGLPWDAPLTTLRNDLTGPVAFTISLLAMVACGAALVFGGEINEFTRRMVLLVMVCAFIVSVVNVAGALGIARSRGALLRCLGDLGHAGCLTHLYDNTIGRNRFPVPTHSSSPCGQTAAVQRVVR